MKSRKGAAQPFSLFAFQDIITSVTGIMILMTMMMALELVQRAINSPAVRTPEITQDLSQAIADNEEEIRRLEEAAAHGTEEIRYDPRVVQRKLKDLKESDDELILQRKKLEKELGDAKEQRSEIEAKLKELGDESVEKITAKTKDAVEQLKKLKSSNRVIFNRPEGDSKSPWLLEVEATTLQAAEVGKSMKPLKFATIAEFKRWLSSQNSAAVYFVMLIKPNGIGQFHELRKTFEDKRFDLGFDLLTAEQNALDPETGAAVQ